MRVESMKKKKIIYVRQGKRTRQAVYCPKCCNKKKAMEYMGEYTYADVPCKCKLSGWKKKIKERFRNG